MMTRRQASVGLLASAAVAAAPCLAVGVEFKAIDLPPPRSEGGQPLIAALRLRHSTRDYSQRPLPVQVLSDLLWAAFGVNRPSGDRTAPYWRHVMVMDIYAAMADGVWLYEPKAHTLLPYLKEDIRAQTGLQDFVAVAPLNLVYVAHGERMTDVSTEDRRLYASVDAGFIGQNVYLFCASEGLPLCFAEPWTIRNSRAHCGCRTSSSSPSRRRWATRALERRFSGTATEQIGVRAPLPPSALDEIGVAEPLGIVEHGDHDRRYPKHADLLGLGHGDRRHRVFRVFLRQQL